MDVEDVCRKTAEIERKLALRTPAENMRSVALLRSVMPQLTVRQRKVAEDMILRFEDRARAQLRLT